MIIGAEYFINTVSGDGSAAGYGDRCQCDAAYPRWSGDGAFEFAEQVYAHAGGDSFAQGPGKQREAAGGLSGQAAGEKGLSALINAAELW